MKKVCLNLLGITALLASVQLARFGVWYIAASALFGILLISTPIITKNASVESVILLVYSAVITPLFEEIIFRGLVWNRLNRIFSKEWMTYIASTLLFASGISAMPTPLPSAPNHSRLSQILCFGRRSPAFASEEYSARSDSKPRIASRQCFFTEP